jgi:bacterial/archaeal transporter family-2 protein
MDAKWIAFLFAFLGGAVLPIQIGINGLLRRFLEHPLQATAVSFAVGAVAAALASIAFRAPLPSLEKISASSLWMWFAGVFGAFYVFTTIFSSPKVGASVAVTLAIAGQVLIALLADHYGWLSFPQSSISLLKIAGAALVIAGVALIAYAKTA